MLKEEQKNAKSSFASDAQAKRCFEQIFPPSSLPPQHFESVVHSGACKWGVIAGVEFCLVPFGVVDQRRIIKISICHIKSLTINRNDKFHFADEETTRRTAKVTIKYIEDMNAEAQQKSRISPVRSITRFLGRNRKSITEDQSSVIQPIEKQEFFYIYEKDTKLFENLHQWWIGSLSCELYGWKSGKDTHLSNEKVRALYLELQNEIHAAKGLQEKVDLLDELAHAVRFNFTLKRLVLFNKSSLLDWMVNELQRLTTTKWQLHPEIKNAGRTGCLQYLMVLLEAIHKTLFSCWPLFSSKELKRDAETFCASKSSPLSQLIQTLWMSFVTIEEMNERRDDTLLLEVVHTIVAIMFEVCNILIELKTESIVQGQPFDKKMELTSQICTMCSDKSIMRRFQVIFYAMRQMLSNDPDNDLRKVRAHNYSFVLYYLTRNENPSTIRDILAAHHQEDLVFVLPRFIASPEDNSHPFDRRSSLCFNEIVGIFSPDQ
mmetsp:Transcript_44327/g.139866  ORF Transcript_44327/g.139866 Transcript_44327/m.139866 type:complete len:489 (+) Transcript_44327:118-1584(+)